MSVFAPANPTPGSVKSVYAHLDCLVEGIDQLKSAGFTDMVVTAPLPRHEIEELIYEGKPSPIRWFTLTGALTGGICGFSVCSLTHLNWPMIIPAASRWSRSRPSWSSPSRRPSSSGVVHARRPHWMCRLP